MQTHAAIDPAHLIDTSGELLDLVRSTTPLVHCITNAVVTNFTANALLALGAAPAMVDLVGEAGPFATVASGLLVNLGTPQPEQSAAAREAVAAARQAGTPWVLDPVAIGALPIRTELAHDLAELRPAAIRGNASEILALAGVGAGGRGVDAADDTDAAAEPAAALARRTGAVVAVSGPVDLVTDGTATVRLANGDALLTRVTGGGCALGAVVAAFLGAARGTGIGALEAVVAAHLAYTVAAEHAADGAAGPGSFAVRFLDALAAVEASELRALARVSIGAPLGAAA
ncbi:hydroxyethylthiazole kinase [Agromyces sp. NPDC060279]|uniref:hydroxyethylthiazole kinase n=1 Tax=Agromyces sp. NPDC060279 TaxID=3347092 RepID=UPI00366980C2